MKDNYSYHQIQQGTSIGGYINIGQGAQNTVAPPSRLTVAAGRLQGQLANYAGAVDRLNRVADRLSGAVPESVAGGKNLAGGGNSVAAMFDTAADDFDSLSQRLTSILERLESL